MEDFFNVEYGIQVIFSTIPNHNKTEFEDNIEKGYFKKYKDEIKYLDEYLYDPIKCYLFGDYDVCYITLIDNFKFAHRLFDAKEKEGSSFYNTHSFQSYSGFALNKKKELINLFSEKPTEYFVGIFNLKLNNGLLIGNGLEFIETVRKKIGKILKGKKFLLVQTFSWFELSLIVFLEDTNSLTEILIKLRNLEFFDVKTNKLLENSLYNSLFDDEKRIYETSVFSDTHTYVGFNQLLINKDEKSNYIKDFKNNASKFKLNTEIEWHIKPGHLHSLNKLLEDNPNFKSFYKNSDRKLVLGKSDFLLQEKEGDILFNYHLFKLLSKDDKETRELFSHIRKVRSYVYLNANSIEEKAKVKKNPLSWVDKLKYLTVDNAVFKRINKHLKSLKVSRQIRNKVLKLFSNYNNGIQNPILFPFFIDFKIFTENLVKLIDAEYKYSQEGFFKLREFEEKINKSIDIFQEGYNVRFINGYQFENISDFNLGFNSSVQLLLTSYWSLVYEYGILFYDKKNYSPIIQLNNIDTVSNEFSINYSIHHLTSPEFISTTLSKELLNNLEYANDAFFKMKESFQNEQDTILYNINETYLDDLIASGLFDMNNFIIDAIRYVVSFNLNFKLMEHWFWSYSFQNSSLYNSSGMFNEDRLKSELFRIMLVRDFYGIKEKMTCPIPSLYTYWARHYDKLTIVSDRFVKQIKSSESEIYLFIKHLANKYLSTYLAYNDDTFDKTTLKMIDKLNNSNVVPKIIDKNNFFSKQAYLKFKKKMNYGKQIHKLDELMYDILEVHYKKMVKRLLF